MKKNNIVKEESFTDHFDKIYKEKRWVSRYSNPSSLSGPGSFPEISQKYLDFLSNFCENNNIKSIVDYGCGDVAIYEEFNLKKYSYTGIDASQRAIDIAQKKYPNMTFKCQETFDIPSGDLLIVKDVFGHWSGVRSTKGLGDKSNLIKDFLKINYNNFPFILIVDGHDADLEKYFEDGMKFKIEFFQYGSKNVKMSSKKIYIKKDLLNGE